MEPTATTMTTDSSHDRLQMVNKQLVSRGIRDLRVLSAVKAVPRELFIPERDRRFAYDDAPQPIGCGQTISQPYIVAYMLELARITETDRVLEVGTGTGYQAALLAHLARSVVTIERHEPLAHEARRLHHQLGIANCEVLCGDGTRGVVERGPYDVILVAASGPRVPESLVQQLAPSGRLVCPVGERTAQRLVRVTKSRDGRHVTTEPLDPVVFVPLIGDEGWPATTS